MSADLLRSERAETQFDPWTPENLPDPFAYYKTMRETDPLHWSEQRSLWFATRYSDAVSVLKDRRFSAARWHTTRPHNAAPGQDPELARQLRAKTMAEVLEEMGEPPTPLMSSMFPFGGPSLTDMDAPEHTRLRSLQTPYFTPRKVEWLRPRIEKIVDNLLDEVASDGVMDARSDFAYPIPTLVVAELLGIPPELNKKFIDLTAHESHELYLDPLACHADEFKAAIRRGFGPLVELRKTIEAVIDAKRESPGEDVISYMLAAGAEGDRLSQVELVVMATSVHFAGHKTTVNLIGNGIHALLRHPEQLERLRHEPELITSTVEEVLRFDPPLHHIGRVATEDVGLSGKTIREGQCVMTMLAAAGRDPEQFEEPDTFRIDRWPNHHLDFGQGPHICLGASVARLETQIALQRLVERLPELRLAGEPELNPTFEMRGFRQLPVRF